MENEKPEYNVNATLRRQLVGLENIKKMVKDDPGANLTHFIKMGPIANNTHNRLEDLGCIVNNGTSVNPHRSWVGPENLDFDFAYKVMKHRIPTKAERDELKAKARAEAEKTSEVECADIEQAYLDLVLDALTSIEDRVKALDGRLAEMYLSQTRMTSTVLELSEQFKAKTIEQPRSPRPDSLKQVN